MRNNSMMRLVTVTILGILGLWLIYILLFGSGMGIGVNMGYRGYYGGGHMNMGFGYGIGNGFTLAYVLLLLIKVLFVVFIVALIAGIAIWIKNNVFTRDDIDTIRNTFSGNKNTCHKETCAACGKTIEADWKLCPHCGKEKEI